MLIRQDVDMVKIEIKELILFLILLIKFKPLFIKEKILSFSLCVRVKWPKVRGVYSCPWYRIMWGTWGRKPKDAVSNGYALCGYF